MPSQDLYIKDVDTKKAFPIVYGKVMRQWMYGEGHYNCYAMPLAHSLKWDHACWNCLDDDVEKFDNTCKTMYRGENGTIRLITDNRAPTINAQKQKIGDLWMLPAPIIIWSILTTICTRVLSANKRPPAESIKLI